jgi:transcriptional regulator with XRE-family HTH domain
VADATLTAMTTRPRLRLRELRDTRGLSRAELARRAGLSSGTMSRHERGRRGVAGGQMAILARPARALGVKPEELVEEAARR